MIKEIREKNDELNINSKKIKQLKELFPSCFTEDGKIDLIKLENELNTDINIIKEGYGLNFLGKNYAKLISSLDTETVIVPDEDNNSKEINKDSNNIFVSGDNIDALKHLLKSYYKQIRCIYIDPPYNTGSDGFAYNDKFNFSVEKLISDLDISEEEAKRVFEMTNSKSNSHSAWLTFMYPRLYIARQLLKDNGVIFISIDDNEQSNLKLLCDNIFGNENYVGMFSVENNPKGRRNSDFISVSNEYCLVYAKDKSNKESCFIENIPKCTSDMMQNEDGEYIQAGGRRTLVGEQTFNNEADFKSDKHYSVYYNPSTNDLELLKEKSIDEKNIDLINEGYKRYISYNGDKFVENTYTMSTFKEMFEDNSLIFSDEKIYEKNDSTTIRIKSMLTNKKYDAIINGEVVNDYEIDLKTTSAGTRLKELFGLDEVPFSAPKNENFISLLVSLFEDKDLVCLDFFAGSATTAHAIMNLNAKDGGNRKYILVQLPEDLEKNYETSSSAGKKTIKVQIDYLNNINKPLYLDEIGQERIRLAGEKIKSESSNNIDIGFKHYFIKDIDTNTLDKLEKFEPNWIDSDKTILSEFGINTVLTTWMVSDGYGLTDKYDKLDLDGYTAYQCKNTIYLITPDISDSSIKYLIEKYEKDNDFECNRIVMFGYSFNLNEIQTLKDNLKQVKNIKNINVDLITRY
ncbi:MAG: site-specific DNA-methyltransferase [Bacilli bacterium]|nr:site-specific DNA-methyltransferase [Bacilli bacterium]